MNIEIYAVNDVVTQTETDLSYATGAVRLRLLVSLGWHLRQRDTKRALLLADEVENLLPEAGLTEAEQQSIALRLMLIRGEGQWLFGETDESRELAENALQGFTTLGDAIGCADAHRLFAFISVDEGNGQELRASLEGIITCATGIDPVRVLLAEAATALVVSMGSNEATKANWVTRFAAGSGNAHPAAGCWIEDFLGIIANQNGDYVQSIRHWSKTYTLALVSGQPRRARIAAGNIGDAFNKLNEYQTALEWMQRGLDLARQSGWPSMIGFALTQTAETMRRLQRFDEAHNLLSEALTLMTAITGSRYYATALHFLGDIELDLKQYANALATFRLLERRATILNLADLLSNSLRGQATALFELGHPQQALKAAQAALDGAKLNFPDQIATLCVMAEIHVRYPLPPPPDMNAASIPLHYLQQAQNLAANIADYIMPGNLLDAIAEEHAKLGDYVQAWQTGKQASMVREKKHQQEAANRANAMLVSHQTERTLAEQAYHRELESEARRTSVLQQTSNTLEHLAGIGQEITACLNIELMFGVLNQHVHHLLDANIFGITRINADGQTFGNTLLVEDGTMVAPERVKMYKLESAFPRFKQERCEILVDQDPAENEPDWPADLAKTASRLFAQLCLGDKILGWMTVQSRKRHAYGSREQFIFRTLCAYASIAISNADALQALHQAQAQLVQQEKMAALANLVTNFAHQLNTPIAAVKSSSKNITETLNLAFKEMPQLFQTLDKENQAHFMLLINNSKEGELLGSREERAIVQELIVQLEAAKIEQAPEKARILAQLNGGAILQQILPLLQHNNAGCILNAAHQFAIVSGNAANINTATARMAKIISALKSFSGTEQSHEKVLTQLDQGIEAALALYQSQMQNHVEIIRDYQTIAPLPCLPDQIGQVWANLIHNALHAMNYKGQLGLSIRQEGNDAVVAIKDSGDGIDEKIRERIFDAFFTTKNMGEGSGLGLAIVKMIIDRHQGRIKFESNPDGGSTFTVFLPYSPPCYA